MTSSKIKISHDGSLDIAVGKSRRETHWKNKQFLWSTLVNRLSETHRTHESAAEYLAMKKEDQDKIKDVGGFVGGFLTGGRKKAGSVLHRQLVTLDIDFANADFWDDFSLVYSCSAALYSTHSHTPEKPRLRLLIPLDREVTPEEYEAISRRIAGNLGIEQFDTTTFQPERLMYWPNSSKDAEYIFKYQDGNWLKADEVLNTYVDWQDSSSWPISAKANKVIERGIKKQGDPLEKPGVIGAFCRTYPVSEAIGKFLGDAYEACDQEGRFTYKEGSTAAGLVVYDDKYAFSHHGTDPTSGKLCNAFDLVRIHLFGLKDEDAGPNTPTNKLPSFVAMQEFCTKDGRVRKLLGKERLAEAMDDFKGEMLPEGEEPGEETFDWLEKLDVEKKGGAYKGTIQNVSIILENDPRLKGCFATDDFRMKKVVLKNLPWRKVSRDTRFVKDQDEQNLVKYLEKLYNISGRLNIKDAFDTHIDANGFHPVRDYLGALEWDGRKRVDTLFIDYLGAENSEYMRAVTRKTLVAAVARVHEPGVKFDYILTIIGPQGAGKSTLIKKLGREWFSDSFNFNMLHTKEAFEQMQGYWIIEISELNGMRKTEVDAAKSFISKTEDNFRPAFGRNTVAFRRQSIFIGSTNNRDFLRDQTGNRRFWPVDITKGERTRNVFKDLTTNEVNQIWAEAVKLYKTGEPLHLSEELEREAAEQQREHTEQDGRVGIIEQYLDMLLPDNWSEMSVFDRRAYIQGDELQAEGTIKRNRVCVPEIFCEALGGNQKDMDKVKVREMHEIMRNMPGWGEHKTKMKFGKYGVQKGYRREKTGVAVKMKLWQPLRAHWQRVTAESCQGCRKIVY